MGLLRGVAVGGAAYAIGKRRARRQAEEEQAAVEEQQAAQAPSASDANITKLQELKSMHDSGILTDDEFADAKSKVLANM